MASKVDLTRGARKSVAIQGQVRTLTRLIVFGGVRPQKQYGAALKFALCGNTHSKFVGSPILLLGPGASEHN